MIHKNFQEFDGVQMYSLGYAPLGIKDLLYSVYFFKIGDTLIDTGSRRTRAHLPEFNKGEIAQVLLTHFHEDHSGNAAYFNRKFNAPIYAHELTKPFVEKGFPVQMYESIMFQSIEPCQTEVFPEVIEIGGNKVEILHLPGHSVDHCCFYIPEKGHLFSGDLYVADRIKLWRKSEDLEEQIQSLNRLLQLDFDVLFCSHNPKLKNGKMHLRNKYNFLTEFREQVLSYRDLPVDEIMKKLKLKEKHMEKWVSWGDVSVKNMVKAALKV